VADFKERIDELARLMEEFHLAEARLESEGTVVSFRRRPSSRTVNVVESEDSYEGSSGGYMPATGPAVEEAPAGQPITSPMTGIFYGSPSPNAPDFVKEGDTVSAGQIIGLIEAMKVFNEIPCALSGTVLKVLVESGQVVQLGDVLMRIG
jgi:acetyl-CoA carboxylase biotin carboxyl carrier protein